MLLNLRMKHRGSFFNWGICYTLHYINICFIKPSIQVFIHFVVNSSPLHVSTHCKGSSSGQICSLTVNPFWTIFYEGINACILIIHCKTYCWATQWWPLQEDGTGNGSTVHIKNDKDTCTHIIKQLYIESSNTQAITQHHSSSG